MAGDGDDCDSGPEDVEPVVVVVEGLLLEEVALVVMARALWEICGGDSEEGPAAAD